MVIRDSDKITAIDKFELAALRLSDIKGYPEDERKDILLQYFQSKQHLKDLLGIKE